MNVALIFVKVVLKANNRVVDRLDYPILVWIITGAMEFVHHVVFEVLLSVFSSLCVMRSVCTVLVSCVQCWCLTNQLINTPGENADKPGQLTPLKKLLNPAN